MVGARRNFISLTSLAWPLWGQRLGRSILSYAPILERIMAWPKPSLRFYALPILLAIAACTATPTPVCPAIVEYTPAEQLQAAKDLDLIPDTSPVHRFMGDYKQLRAKLRTCR